MCFVLSPFYRCFFISFHDLIYLNLYLNKCRYLNLLFEKHRVQKSFKCLDCDNESFFQIVIRYYFGCTLFQKTGFYFRLLNVNIYFIKIIIINSLHVNINVYHKK